MDDDFSKYLVKLGRNIAKHREAKGITQYRLAKDLIMEQSNLGRIENGQTNPTIKTLYRIALKLEISVTSLLTFK